MGRSNTRYIEKGFETTVKYLPYDGRPLVKVHNMCLSCRPNSVSPNADKAYARGTFYQRRNVIEVVTMEYILKH